jgi:hypothetical protein
MLPVSLDCPFSFLLRYSLTFICPAFTQDIGQIHAREYRRGYIKRDNPEKLAKYGTQDTGQINVREYRMGNKSGQSRETGNIRYTRHWKNKC